MALTLLLNLPPIREPLLQIGQVFIKLCYHRIIIMQAIDFLFSIAVLVMSVVLHEISHGYVANALGDKTAKQAGRLTLNPLAHLDPFGSVILPVFLFLSARLFGGGIIFGWAKPVPYNPHNLKNQKFGPALVAAAGPLSNFFIALLFSLFIRFAVPANLFPTEIFSIIGFIISINLILMLFNLIPIPPLDGSKILLAFFPDKWRQKTLLFERFGLIIVLVFLFSFFPVILKIASGLFLLLTGF